MAPQLQPTQEKSQHHNPVLNSVATASMHMAMNGANNPIVRALLTGLHVAIESTKEQKHFLNGLMNTLQISAPETYATFSNLVSATPLLAFSERFSLAGNPGPSGISAAKRILEEARKKVGVTNNSTISSLA